MLDGLIKIHTAFLMREWLCANDVTVLEWPSRSPDENSIHLCHWLKVRVNRLHPHLSLGGSADSVDVTSC